MKSNTELGKKWLLKVTWISYLIILLFLTSTVQAIEWNNEKFMSLGEIEKLMTKGVVKGKCKTVFKGTEVEEFDIEIISIERNAMPNWDVIWARGKGGSFEETGVAGGMSGSPCYIDGRLFGALSLGASWQKEGDIFGITPIELMVDVAKWGMKPKLGYSGGISSSFGIDVFDTVYSGEYDEENFDQLTVPPNRPNFMKIKNTEISSVEIPVSISGISSRTMEFLNLFFSEYNMVPFQNGGTSKKDVEAPIQPGQIIGTEFARGDFSAFGYGTLTYSENGEFLAYGHPAMGEGNINLPVSTGYVHYILPSRQRSFKVASAAQTVGTVVQDRIPAIAGMLGESPSYIPVDIELKAGDMPSNSESLHFQALRHKRLSASIAMAGIWSLVDGFVRESGDYTVETRAAISFSGENLQSTTIEKRNIISGYGPGFGAAQMLRPLSSLIGNNFQPVHVDKVTVDIKVKDKRNFAVIESVIINKERYRPGEEVKLEVTLRPYLEKPVVESGKIKIPEDMPDGEFRLLVSSASSYQAWQRNRAPLNFQPTNLKQLIELLQQDESNDSIIFEIFAPKRGMTVEGEEMPDLPVSMLSVLNSPVQTGTRGMTKGTSILVEKIRTDYVVGGNKVLRLTVDRNTW